jgi:tRNA(Ile)-lysidine synthetase-like protein
MNVVLPKPGIYVVAVSGGVDSVGLLHLLSQEPALQLIVAHFDHGMRADSGEDMLLVRDLAQQYALPFVFDVGQLGPEASEATARTARYDFLHTVQRRAGAQAIITAHHQDDVLETAIINMLRGTGRKGLTSLRSQTDILRPLLAVPKSELRTYAQANGLVWHEDTTNQDTAYLRNYIRHKLLPRFDQTARADLVRMITELTATNQELDDLLTQVINFQLTDNRLDRQWFTGLPHAVAREVMAAWLRGHDVRDFDRKTLERLVVAAKVAAAGKSFHIRADWLLHITATHLALNRQER